MLIRIYFPSWENSVIETQRRKFFGIEIANLVKLPTFCKKFSTIKFHYYVYYVDGWYYQSVIPIVLPLLVDHYSTILVSYTDFEVYRTITKILMTFRLLRFLLHKYVQLYFLLYTNISSISSYKISQWICNGLIEYEFTGAHPEVNFFVWTRLVVFVCFRDFLKILENHVKCDRSHEAMKR